MRSLESLASGFLVATGLVCFFSIMALVRGGDAWLGLTYLLILLIPATTIAILKLKNNNPVQLEGAQKWRNLLFAFQGVALGFWMFDILTTFYAINVAGLAVELNPLGWPLGILGAFAFYGPTLLFSYVLLFRIKESFSLYAAVLLTLITLGMGTMNLVAGAQNFQVFVDTAVLATSMRYGFLALITALNLVIPLALWGMITQPKPNLAIKNA